jgi:hypothetical protein
MYGCLLPVAADPSWPQQNRVAGNLVGNGHLAPWLLPKRPHEIRYIRLATAQAYGNTSSSPQVIRRRIPRARRYVKWTPANSPADTPVHCKPMSLIRRLPVANYTAAIRADTALVVVVTSCRSWPGRRMPSVTWATP